MNLTGYVPLRRGVLEHTMAGKLSTQEFAAFTALVLLADKETGAGRINAPVLTSWLPDLSYDAAKRALLSLESKRYIFREIVPFSKRMYVYWVNRYTLTSGPHRLLQTDLSKVFESKEPKDIRYIDPAPQTAPQAAPQTALQSALHNKTGEREEIIKNPVMDTGECVDDCTSTAVSTRANCAHSEQASEQLTAHQLRDTYASTTVDIPSQFSASPEAFRKALLTSGFEYRDGRYLADGRESDRKFAEAMVKLQMGIEELR